MLGLTALALAPASGAWAKEIDGNNQPNIIVGTKSGDRIHGHGGGDHLEGKGGPT